MKPAGLIIQALGWNHSLLCVAEILHYALGVIMFPIGYILALALTGMRGGIVSGVLWGVILWIAAGTIMMSLAGAPLFRGFGKATVAVLVAHLAYGGVFGPGRSTTLRENRPCIYSQFILTAAFTS